MESQPVQTDTRQKILDAALELFSKNGFYATTTRLIAQFADVNEVTLFRLFKTKQQLFHEILKHVKAVGFDSKRLEEGEGLEPEAAIRFLIDTFTETLEEHPKEFKVMFHAVMDEVEEFESEFMGKHQSKLVDFLEKAFKMKARTSGKTQITDFRMHTLVLLSTLMGLATSRILTKKLPIKNYDRQAICDYVAKLFLSMA